ncbi:1-deoxy-D-xylulose-5-phosphate synthase [Deinococcus cellulosilyticus NBRC 106333 = KACC 11606]|uniref:1-deoxy-D-xylulose-5-phosphate synthase n=1 Tax=Deinococcus cellulosilyticus (strain DSM 18568 / NBRC 106333 / KACC 11606 / 5516J-15) TaxID=1223518 RepID=A0A511N6W4_DEIC1|nr:1-deoxy-D-xylulose-5-phosphate synthase [Deinococcus cellulosilyticus NBRC 106333 = KACC 11606]
MLLDRINGPEDLKNLTREELSQVAQELRQEIIQVCAESGGHLASSLGAVELITALHHVFDSPRDRLLFDVGHQAYAHKILTGRRKQMPTIRKEGGLSGFTKVSESEHDAITVGHASTSLANALGMAFARDALGQNYNIVAVIGDGSLTGGMALAAINQIGYQQKRMLIILNDNEMSISENVGALNRYMRTLQIQRWFQDVEDAGKKALQAFSRPLAQMVSRAKDSARNFFDPASDNPFKAMNVRYVGPIDGHDLGQLVYVLSKIKDLEGPTMLHVVTKKGKGLEYAEKDPIKWHGAVPHDPKTGTAPASKGYSWSSAFGDAMIELAKEDPRLFVITPAMREGSGLVKYSQTHPHRYTDVGIAEDVAVTVGAGMALQGLKPVVAIYSTFLQRGFDQVLHDVAIENLPVIFAIDRGGMVGADGATHHGVFDIAYLRSIPNMSIALPKDTSEMRAMFRGALKHGGPVAIRYPRGNTDQVAEGTWPEMEWGSWEWLNPSEDVVILAGGKALEYARKAVKDLPGVGLVNARFVKPLDHNMLESIGRTARAIITVEDHQKMGGFGSAVLEFLAERGLTPKVRVLGIPDQFFDHAEVSSIHAQAGIDAQAIRTVLAELGVDVPIEI